MASSVARYGKMRLTMAFCGLGLCAERIERRFSVGESKLWRAADQRCRSSTTVYRRFVAVVPLVLLVARQHRFSVRFEVTQSYTESTEPSVTSHSAAATELNRSSDTYPMSKNHDRSAELMTAVPVKLRGSIVSGMRWTFWLSALVVSFSFTASACGWPGDRVPPRRRVTNEGTRRLRCR